MVTVTSGKNWKGEPCEFYMNIKLYESMSKIKKIVKTKDFDYVAIIAGLPGMGKSNLAMTLAKFCDENFNINQIAMTADDFIEKTSTLPKGSAVVLDESFASMNSKMSTSKDFIRIINHLQLIRQRNLFIFLCLPNFFDLGKAISIYRSMHLFVCYGESFGKRGEFAIYNRTAKRNLYIKGIKYMNYQVQQPNFRGKFYRQKAINEEVYDKMKWEHLKENDRQLVEKNSTSVTKNLMYRAIVKLYERDKAKTKERLYDVQKICNEFGISHATFAKYKAIYGQIIKK